MMKIHVLVLLSSGFLISGCYVQPEAREARPKVKVKAMEGGLPMVSIPLMGSTRDIEGLELPESFHGRGVNGFDLPERCDLRIPVPGRRTIHLRVQRLTIVAIDGLVRGVFIWRPLQPLRFKALVANLVGTLKDQGFELERGMQKTLSTWPEDQPDQKGNLFPIPYKTGLLSAFGEIGDVNIRVSPSAEGGWFYMWTIETSLKARYATEIAEPDSPKQMVYLKGPDAGRLTGEPAKNDHPIPLHGASVRLPGAAREIDGIDVPLRLIAGRSGTAGIARPHALTINRPHAKPLTLLARKASATIRDGEVREVTLVRPLLSSPFQKAIEDIINAVEAEDAYPALVKPLIADWSEASGAREFRTTLRGVFDELEAEVHMTKDADTGGWSYTMTFRPAPARKPAAPVAEKPPQPLKGQMRRALPAVSVHLPGPARQVEGVVVPAGILAGQPGRVEVDHPCDLTVIRADGQPMWMPMRGATLAFRGGRVESVTAHRPYMPLPLEKAIDDLLSVARGLRIDTQWDFGPKVRAWLRRAGAPEFVAAYPNVPEGLDLEIRLKRVDDVDQWTYTLTFRAAAGLGAP